MRKEILDFIKAESRPNQHERNDDPRELMWAIVDIYKQRKADAITLQNDLEALVFESRLHENYKDASILEGLNPQQTENDHKAALFNVNNCIDYLIMTAKKWGVTLPESEIQKYDCIDFARDYTLADFIRWEYGTNTKKTSLDKLNDPEKLAKAVKFWEQMLLDQNDNDVSENEQPADTSTPSAVIMEDATDLTPATNENQGKGTAGRPTADDFTTYFKKPEWAKFLLPALHEILDGQKGTFRAKVIAAITDVYINKPALKSVHNEFNDGKKDTTFEQRYNIHYGDYYRHKMKPFPEDELEAIRNELLEICNQEHEAAGGHVSDTSTP